ncbi:MAG TPA: MOSC N-terminal beta barrel domain-containing protein [Alphaproteobacteria bacterium]|jgi:uncharacterized protein YcbX|nr:MOSC N-terminal beta barrel domain-containing protein [Alphaproteobacteria bacterium]
MAATLCALYRYPIKGFTGETLETVSIEPGAGLPGDRKIAVTTGAQPFDPATPEPWPKAGFLTVMRYPALVRVRARYDGAGDRLSAALPGEAPRLYDFAEGNERQRFGQDIKAYLGLPDAWRPEVVAGDERRFTDAAVEGPRLMESLSLINLATLAELARHAARAVDHRRFRANLYIDGLAPWAEFDWVDREFRIGGIAFRGLLKTPRCAAIEADPDSGETGAGLIKLLQATWGHHHCGIQVEATAPGVLAIGAPVEG